MKVLKAIRILGDVAEIIVGASLYFFIICFDFTLL